MISIEFSDGKVYTGWRAFLWFIVLSPIIVPWMAFMAVLLVTRVYPPLSDAIAGFVGLKYEGSGGWVRK